MFFFMLVDINIIILSLRRSGVDINYQRTKFAIYKCTQWCRVDRDTHIDETAVDLSTSN